MSLPEEEKFPVPVSEVRRGFPRYYLETGILLVLVVALGLFLLTSRYWLDDEPWFVGVWAGTVDHAAAGRADERIELRMAGDRVTGNATYRGVRRVVEDVHVSGDQPEFITRGRDRIGDEHLVVVFRYQVRQGEEGDMLVTVTVSDGRREGSPQEFSLARQ